MFRDVLMAGTRLGKVHECRIPAGIVSSTIRLKTSCRTARDYRHDPFADSKISFLTFPF